MKLFISVIAAALLGAASGCVYHERAVAPEPVTAGYVEYDYTPVYYDRGWYDGPYWYWRGHDGRLFHERREAREHHHFERQEHEHEFRR